MLRKAHPSNSILCKTEKHKKGLLCGYFEESQMIPYVLFHSFDVVTIILQCTVYRQHHPLREMAGNETEREWEGAPLKTSRALVEKSGQTEQLNILRSC